MRRSLGLADWLDLMQLCFAVDLLYMVFHPTVEGTHPMCLCFVGSTDAILFHQHGYYIDLYCSHCHEPASCSKINVLVPSHKVQVRQFAEPMNMNS